LVTETAIRLREFGIFLTECSASYTAIIILWCSHALEIETQYSPNNKNTTGENRHCQGTGSNI